MNHTNALLAFLLAVGLGGTAMAQQEDTGQQQQQQQNQNATNEENGPFEDAETFIFGEEEELEEAGFVEEEWASDEFGLYYEDYYWDAGEEFEEWYGEAEDDWFDLF